MNEKERLIRRIGKSAGGETTAQLMSTSFRILGDRPDLQATLRAEPDKMPAFIEEALRLEPPIKGEFRLSKVPVKVAQALRRIPCGCLRLALAAGPEKSRGGRGALPRDVARVLRRRFGAQGVCSIGRRGGRARVGQRNRLRRNRHASCRIARLSLGQQRRPAADLDAALNGHRVAKRDRHHESHELVPVPGTGEFPPLLSRIEALFRLRWSASFALRRRHPG